MISKTTWIPVRDDLMIEKMHSFWHCPSCLHPHPTQKRCVKTCSRCLVASTKKKVKAILVIIITSQYAALCKIQRHRIQLHYRSLVLFASLVGFDPEKYSVDTTQGSDDFLSAGQFGRIFEETLLM